MNQNDGQNKLGNNNPNQGVPNNQNGSSFNAPKHDAPHAGHSNGSFQDSLNRRPTRMDDDSPRSSFDKVKDAAKNKLIDAIPGGRQARNVMDMGKKANDALKNIRANKGPQLPPRRNDSPTGDSQRMNNNSDFGSRRPSFLPRRPKFLDNNEDDDSDTTEEQENRQSLFGGNRKTKGGNLSYLASGFLKMSPIVKLVLLIGITLFPLMIFFMAISPLLTFNSTSAIGIADGNEDYKTSEDEEAFQKRVKEVQEEYSEDGKNFEAKYIGAVYTILSNYGKDYSYKNMTKSKIREIADLMFDENGSFSEDTFKENLQNKYFPDKIPGKDDETYKRYVEDMFNILEYYDENKNRDSIAATGVTGAVCTYNFPAINAEQYGTGIKKRTINANNIMVRLMSAGGRCDGTYGVPIEGEELVPLEKYALGVAYAEIGASSPEEAFKAQIIVAKSFALSVPDASGNTGGRKLYEESGQWILQISNCVTDQVYCDPDRGCSVNGASDNQDLVMHSGTNTASTKHFDPLPANAPQRQWASEVSGKVALDSSGNVYLTNFLNTDQNAWISMANQGMDYTQIILKHYPGVASISESNCVDSSDGTSAGNYVAWKQSDSQWSSVVLGGGSDSSRSIGNIGCLATSISMLIAKSGAVDSITDATLKSNFNPGTFVEAMNKVGGFDSGGNLYWANVSKVVPNFVYSSSSTQTLSGLSKDQKLEAIKTKTSQANTYCVVEVKGGQGQHWVAVDSVNGTNIKMLDPGSKATNLWKQYDWNRTSVIQCFKKQ